MANLKVGLTRNFTASDSDVSSFNMIMVTGSSGDVVLDLEGGDTHTITGAPTNVWIPVGNAIRIKATGTTATGFLVV